VDALFLLGVVAVTSAVLALVARRRHGPAGDAFGRVLEWAGLTVAFLVLNLVAGVIGVWLLRAITGQFVSMYVNTDTTLVLLSMAQAVAAQWWGTSRKQA
jgi:hypothetical protein